LTIGSLDAAPTDAPPAPDRGTVDGTLDGDAVADGLATAERESGPLTRHTFESMRDPGFRWFFAALMGHFTAMNMQMFIRGWMVFQLTGSYSMLGAITLATAIPQIFLSLVGGVIADLVPQKKLIVQLGQFANALNALVIAALIFSDQISVQHLIIAAVVQGSTMSLMLPARQAMTPELVGPERLMNAMALSTAGMNTARLVMPGLAGWLVAAVGGGVGVDGAQYVYVLMTVMYLVAVLLLIKVPNTTASRDGATRSLAGAVRDLRDGLAYIRGNRDISLVLWVNLILEVVAMPYFFLLPGFVADVLDGGALQVGTLMSISGIGSLAGSLLIASLPNRRRGLAMMLSTVVLGVALLAFSASTIYSLSAVIFIVVGFGQTARFALSGVLIQAYTTDEYRGRVSSAYNLSWGFTNFGTFGVGLAADAIGVQVAIGATAVSLLASVALILAVTRIRSLD
jgi:MFS family permease